MANLTAQLATVGAKFVYNNPSRFVGPMDPFDAVASYHVRPDASSQDDEQILRFWSREELTDWIEARRQEIAALAAGETKAARKVMNDFHVKWGHMTQAEVDFNEAEEK